jgi:hypothetical protein
MLLKLVAADAAEVAASDAFVVAVAALAAELVSDVAAWVAFVVAIPA